MSTPGKKPPPSPVRGSGVRPAAPVRSSASPPNVDSSAPSLNMGLILGGAGAAVFAGVLLVIAIWFVASRSTAPRAEQLATADEPSAKPSPTTSSPESPLPTTPAEPSTPPVATGTPPASTAVEESPAAPKSNSSAPSAVPMPIPPMSTSPLPTSPSPTSPPDSSSASAADPFATPVGTAPVPMPSAVPVTPVTGSGTNSAASSSKNFSGGALADLRAKNSALGLGDGKTLLPRALADIGVDKPSECKLTVVSADADSGPSLDLAVRDPAPEKRLWIASAASGAAKKKPLGEFALEAGKLTFQWYNGATGSAPLLANALIEVEAYGEKEVCQLCEPVLLKPSPMKSNASWKLEFTLPPAARGGCELELLPREFPKYQFAQGSTLKPNGETVLTLQGDSNGSERAEAELKIGFTVRDEKAVLEFTSFMHIPFAEAKKRTAKRTAFSRDQLNDRRRELRTEVKAATKKQEEVKLTITQLETQRNAYYPNSVQRVQLSANIAAGNAILVKLESDTEDLEDQLKWHEDMLQLADDLEKGTLGIQVYRPLGDRRIVYILPQDSP